MQLRSTGALGLRERFGRISFLNPTPRRHGHAASVRQEQRDRRLAVCDRSAAECRGRIGRTSRASSTYRPQTFPTHGSASNRPRRSSRTVRHRQRHVRSDVPFLRSTTSPLRLSSRRRQFAHGVVRPRDDVHTCQLTIKAGHTVQWQFGQRTPPPAIRERRRGVGLRIMSSGTFSHRFTHAERTRTTARCTACPAHSMNGVITVEEPEPLPIRIDFGYTRTLRARARTFHIRKDGARLFPGGRSCRSI